MRPQETAYPADYQSLARTAEYAPRKKSFSGGQNGDEGRTAGAVYLMMPIEIRTEHKGGMSSTRYQQLASLFVYAGLQLMEIQRVGPKSLLFVHYDPDNEAPELERSFFEPDG